MVPRNVKVDEEMVLRIKLLLVVATNADASAAKANDAVPPLTWKFDALPVMVPHALIATVLAVPPFVKAEATMLVEPLTHEVAEAAMVKVDKEPSSRLIAADETDVEVSEMVEADTAPGKYTFDRPRDDIVAEETTSDAPTTVPEKPTLNPSEADAAAFRVAPVMEHVVEVMRTALRKILNVDADVSNTADATEIDTPLMVPVVVRNRFPWPFADSWEPPNRKTARVVMDCDAYIL